MWEEDMVFVFVWWGRKMEELRYFLGDESVEDRILNMSFGRDKPEGVT